MDEFLKNAAKVLKASERRRAKFKPIVKVGAGKKRVDRSYRFRAKTRRRQEQHENTQA